MASPADDDLDGVVHVERDRLDAAHEYVLAAAVEGVEERLHHELGRDQRLAVGALRDAVEEADRLKRLERKHARAVVGRTLAVRSVRVLRAVRLPTL